MRRKSGMELHIKVRHICLPPCVETAQKQQMRHACDGKISKMQCMLLVVHPTHVLSHMQVRGIDKLQGPQGQPGPYDAYCLASLGFQHHRTRHIEDTFSPYWNEELVFDATSLDSSDHVVKFEVWSQGTLADRLLRVTYLPLETYAPPPNPDTLPPGPTEPQEATLNLLPASSIAEKLRGKALGALRRSQGGLGGPSLAGSSWRSSSGGGSSALRIRSKLSRSRHVRSTGELQLLVWWVKHEPWHNSGGWFSSFKGYY